MEKSPLALAKTLGRLRVTLFSSQPIKYFISLEGTFFSALEHMSNHARQIARTVDFQHPKRQYPERPWPVSIVYFIKVLNICDN